MKYRVIVLARARLDVAGIFDWIAARSAEGAQRWLDQFEKAAAALETNPLIAPLAPESGSFDVSVR
jgi:plasmid stabilization system protein ParE